jgi:hypothetical protein
MVAPTITNTTPTAASGTRTGAMSSAAGRIKPTAARSSGAEGLDEAVAVVRHLPPSVLRGQLLLGHEQLRGGVQ